MCIKTKDGAKEISDYYNAVMFLKDNNWSLDLIPEEQQKEFLKFAQISNFTVAHKMALYGYEFTDPEILKLADYRGSTVAHIMASKGYEFIDPEILKLSNGFLKTVAHEMATEGYKFDDPEILKLADCNGCTVAHEMVDTGYEFTDPEILGLVDNKGWTVADICDVKYNTDKFNKILQELGEQDNDKEYETPTPF